MMLVDGISKEKLLEYFEANLVMTSTVLFMKFDLTIPMMCLVLVVCRRLLSPISTAMTSRVPFAMWYLSVATAIPLTL
jgi:hypothetical protein